MAQLAREERRAWLEPWKALAAVIVAATLMTTAVLALANFWRPGQPIVVRFEQPPSVTLIPPQAPK